jgi:hypothetical protein
VAGAFVRGGRWHRSSGAPGQQQPVAAPMPAPGVEPPPPPQWRVEPLPALLSEQRVKLADSMGKP